MFIIDRPRYFGRTGRKHRRRRRTKIRDTPEMRVRIERIRRNEVPEMVIEQFEVGWFDRGPCEGAAGGRVHDGSERACRWDFTK